MAEIEIQLASRDDIEGLALQLSNIQKDINYIVSQMGLEYMGIDQKEGEVNG